jgi:hypothetical protein
MLQQEKQRELGRRHTRTAHTIRIEIAKLLVPKQRSSYRKEFGVKASRP